MRTAFLNFMALLVLFAALFALHDALQNKEKRAAVVSPPTEKSTEEVRRRIVDTPQPTPPRVSAPERPAPAPSPIIVVTKNPKKGSVKTLQEKPHIELDSAEARDTYILQNRLGISAAAAVSEVYIPFENFSQDSIAHK